jgi:N6-adenosine-specific RNA methylase IME4
MPIVPIGSNLGLRGRVFQTGWELPADLSETDWQAAGEVLGKVERSVSWWIGDWWAYGEATYGDRKAIIDADDWQGPAFQTAANAATVCRMFETSRRREILSFSHHAEVAGLAAAAADRWLDWCEETIAETGKPRSTRELRAAVNQARRLTNGHDLVTDPCTVDDLYSLIDSAKKFGCIYADPPWSYDNQATRASTDNHYETMSVDEIAALPIAELAADAAHLHLWTTNAFLFESEKIITAWGFKFRATFTWIKPDMGIGNYWRNAHEIMLTAVRGDATRFDDHSLLSWLQCARGEHSAKPEEVRHRLMRASRGPYLELFARRQEPVSGWTFWGNQIERDLFRQRTAE